MQPRDNVTSVGSKLTLTDIIKDNMNVLDELTSLLSVIEDTLDGGHAQKATPKSSNSPSSITEALLDNRNTLYDLRTRLYAIRELL